MKNKWLLFLIMPLSAAADDVFTTNIQNGCSGSLNADSYLFATFTRSQYQCNSGYYLPANTDHCVICPDIYDCDGGTFIFDEYGDQGQKFKTQTTRNITNGCDAGMLRATTNGAYIIGQFAPNTHTCAPGYYLPANVDECTICPTNSICSGGTYTFNETTDQGIVACTAPTPYAPTGSAVCYPHILHVDDGLVYLRSTKLTSPSLHIRIEDDVFYANMTTIPTRMNKDSPRYFHSQWDDNHYYICDDTTYPGE